MREPVFTETLQVAIVVRDLEAAMRTYVHDYGIGAMVGQVQWELIEPLDDEGIYARFLAEKGEGVHHIAVAAPSFDVTLAAQAEGGTMWFSAASSAASPSRTSPRTASSA